MPQAINKEVLNALMKSFISEHVHTSYCRVGAGRGHMRSYFLLSDGQSSPIPSTFLQDIDNQAVPYFRINASSAIVRKIIPSINPISDGMKVQQKSIKSMP